MCLCAQSALCADLNRQSALPGRLCILPGGRGRGCIQNKGQVILLLWRKAWQAGRYQFLIGQCAVFSGKSGAGYQQYS